MTDEKKADKSCVFCGATATSGITDKLKFKNKKGGTIFIHYKTDGSNNSLCRKCWQNNLKQFQKKIETNLNK